MCLQADFLSKRDAQLLSEAGRSLQPPVHAKLSQFAPMFVGMLIDTVPVTKTVKLLVML